jgi:transglutaminase-like putative cysteine protease
MVEGKLYDWSGSRILRRTAIPSKRRVIGSEDILIPTDLREWITPPESQEVRTAIASMNLPADKGKGTFDRRARLVWKYVTEHVQYCGDAMAQRKQDFWQFPAETLALGKGDCEDCAFLLASLLVASEISSFCVRVVFGKLIQKGTSPTLHSWPIYKDEKGRWCVLESTLKKLPREWHLADDLAKPTSRPRYVPDICLNQHHVWTVGFRRIQDVAAYLRSR